MLKAAPSASDHRLRGLGAIAHPVAVLALVVLIVHDVLLRPLLPGLVAGKVSDVAGLVVFPLVIAALVAVMTPDEDVPIRVGVWVSVVWFGAMKLIGVVATATARLAEVVTPTATVTVDPTDLLALPAVLVAAWVWRHRVAPRAWGAPILVFAVLWSAATSCVGPPEGQGVSLRSDGSFLVDLDTEWVQITSDGRLGETFDTDQVPDEPGPTAASSTCLEDDTCFRADGHDVVAVAPDGSTRTALDIPEDRFEYARRTGGCDQADPFLPVQEIAANDDGVVVVAHGSHGVSIRSAAGDWTRPDVGATIFAGPLPIELVTFAIAVAVLGLQLATWPAGNLGVPATFGVMAAALAVGIGAVAEPIALIYALPALMGAMVVAMVQLGALVTRGFGRHASAVAASHVVAGAVAWMIVWAWSATWMADLGLVFALVGISVASVTAISIVRGRRQGAWPTPEREGPATAVRSGPTTQEVRGGPITQTDPTDPEIPPRDEHGR